MKPHQKQKFWDMVLDDNNTFAERVVDTMFFWGGRYPIGAAAENTRATFQFHFGPGMDDEAQVAICQMIYDEVESLIGDESDTAAATAWSKVTETADAVVVTVWCDW